MATFVVTTFVCDNIQMCPFVSGSLEYNNTFVEVGEDGSQQ